MEPDKHKKKTNKGEEIVRSEPQGLQLLNSDPSFKESFKKVGYFSFCENL